MADTDQTLADTYRLIAPTKFAGLSDDEVIGVAKQLDPKFESRYRSTLGPGFSTDKALSYGRSALNKASSAANTVDATLGNIPGVPELADAGKRAKDWVIKAQSTLTDAGLLGPGSKGDWAAEILKNLIPTSNLGVAAVATPGIASLASEVPGAVSEAGQAAKEFLNNPERGILAQKINPFPSTNPDIGIPEANYLAKAAKVQDQFGPLIDPLESGKTLQSMVSTASKHSAAQAQIPYDILKAMAMQTNAEGTPDALAKALGESGFSLRNIPALQESRIARLTTQMNALEGRAANADTIGQALNPEGGASQGDAIRTLKFNELLDARNKLASFANSQNGAVGTNMPGLAGQTSNQGRLFYGLVKAADEDLASAAGDHPELMAQLKEARAGWKQHMDRFGNDQILGLANKNPSQAADYLFGSTEGVNALQRAVGEPGLDVLRRGVAHQVIDPVASSNNPGRALDNLISSKQEQFDRLFKPSQVDSLRDFAGARENLLNQTEEEAKPGLWSKLAGYFKSKVPGNDEVKLATELTKD